MASSNGVAVVAELFVARLALEVVAEEVAQGWSFPGANRPLFEHEIKARTRFGDLEDSSQAALRAIRAVTDPLWGDVLNDVLSDLMEHSDSAPDLARRLGDLRSTQAGIPGIDSKVADAQARIYQAVLQARHDWAQHTLREAIAQGVDLMTLPAVNDLKPTPAQRAYLEQRAREVAQHPLNRVVEIASKTLGARDLLEVDPLDAIDAIRTAVGQASHDGTDDVAKQAVTDSGNQGRASIAAEGPKPKYVYASELLDGSTCVPCSHLDGHVYASIEESATDYPNGGGYVKCEGGRRCRGTLVYVWPDESDPTVGAPDIPDAVAPAAADGPTPEPEFVARLTGLLHAGKLTPQKLREQAAKASPLGKANADAALAQYEREMAERAAAAPRKFKNIAEARKWATDQWAGPDGYPDDELKVLRDYTGSGYGPMNNTLRSSKGKRTNAKIRTMDAAIERAAPVPERVELVRNSTLRQLGITTTKGDPRNLVGSEFVDHGYMSTSLSRGGAMQGDVRMILNVPPGTKGIYVSGDGGKKGPQIISDYGGGESEIILARGSRFVVTKVSKVGDKWHVEADIEQG